MDDAAGAASGYDVAARIKRVAIFFMYGDGFPRQQGFVYLEPVGRQNGTVCDNLITDGAAQDMVNLDFLKRNLADAIVRNEARLCRRNNGKLVNQLLNLQLLYNADQGIKNNNSHKEHMFILPGYNNEQGQYHV